MTPEEMTQEEMTQEYPDYLNQNGKEAYIQIIEKQIENFTPTKYHVDTTNQTTKPIPEPHPNQSAYFTTQKQIDAFLKTYKADLLANFKRLYDKYNEYISNKKRLSEERLSEERLSEERLSEERLSEGPLSEGPLPEYYNMFQSLDIHETQEIAFQAIKLYNDRKNKNKTKGTVPPQIKRSQSSASIDTTQSEKKVNPEIPTFDHLLYSINSANHKLEKQIVCDENTVNGAISILDGAGNESVKTQLQKEFDTTNDPSDKLHYCIHYCINQITDLLHDVEQEGEYIKHLHEILQNLIYQLHKTEWGKYEDILSYLNDLNPNQNDIASIKISQKGLHNIRDKYFEFFKNDDRLDIFNQNYKEPVVMTKDDCYHLILSEILSKGTTAVDPYVYPESGRKPSQNKLQEFYKDSENRADFHRKYPEQSIDKNYEFNDEHMINDSICNFDAAPRPQAPRIKENRFVIDDVLCQYKYVIYVADDEHADDEHADDEHAANPNPNKKESDDNEDSQSRKLFLYLVIVYHKESNEIYAVHGFKGSVSINLLLKQIGIQTSRKGDGETGGKFYPIKKILEKLGMDTSEPTQDSHVDEQVSKKKLNPEGDTIDTSGLHKVRYFVNNTSNIFVPDKNPDPIIVYKDLDNPTKQTLTLLNKTNGDTLPQLFENVTRYIFTVDSLVPHTFYMLYTNNSQHHCPTTFRSFGKGFLKYPGIETIDNNVKARKYVKKDIFRTRFSEFYENYFSGRSDEKYDTDSIMSTIFEDEKNEDEENKNEVEENEDDVNENTMKVNEAPPIPKLNRIDNLFDLYINHFPKLGGFKPESRLYTLIMVIFLLTEGDYIKDKIDIYKSKNDEIEDNTLTPDKIEEVLKLPDIDYFKSSVVDHAVSQEANDNDIINKIFQNIPDGWDLKCTEQDVFIRWTTTGNRLDNPDKYAFLEKLNANTKNLDDIMYGREPNKANEETIRTHTITIPITLDVLLQLYEHPKLSDEVHRELIREQIDRIIDIICKTSFKDYDDSKRTTMISQVEQVINQVEQVIKKSVVSPLPSPSNNLSGLLPPPPPPTGGSLQNRPKKRFDFRANTKNNYSALSKIMTVKTTNKTKKSRKKKNKTKKSHKKKKKKRQTKRR